MAESGANSLKDLETAWVAPSALTEPAAGGTDAVQILPASVFINPSSNQGWLTIPANAFSGPVAFTAAANGTGALRTALKLLPGLAG